MEDRDLHSLSEALKACAAIGLKGQAVTDAKAMLVNLQNQVSTHKKKIHWIPPQTLRPTSPRQQPPNNKTQGTRLNAAGQHRGTNPDSGVWGGARRV
eukprot:scaffold7267_cov101-Isochrysis_galbana.AAC.1